ncbi:MAG: exosortase E/protease, VPEID-CTERM system [Paracoccaceae bacterium]
MVALDTPRFRTPVRRALIFAALLLVGQLGLIGTVFKHAISFECLANWPQWACAGASGTLIAVYCVLGTLVLMAMLRPVPFRGLVEEAGSRIWPLVVNTAGMVVALVPVLFMRDGVGDAVLVPAFVCWVVGMAMLSLGLMLYVAPAYRWGDFFAFNWSTLVPVIIAGAVTPYLSTLIRPIWRLDTIADWTFSAVVRTIGVLGIEVESFPEHKIIGADGFYINVAPVCSGIEGIALIIVFVSVYLWLFRQNLRFPLAFLLYPVGIAASVAFNVVRISALLAIGLNGNPDLAVGGFHSHAGWLMFTLVALGIIALAQSIPALQKAPVSDQVPTASGVGVPPLFQDPLVARILPFAVFMLSALPASALVNVPGVVYPVRVVLMTLVLALFWRVYKAMTWRIDPFAILVGLTVGWMWILVPVEPSDSMPFGALSGGLLVAWYVLRGFGTMILVPIIEELFFRDYLEGRLRRGPSIGWTVLAAVVTAALFAALHDRWAEAFVAGLAFSWVMYRSRNVSDPIVAHMAANAFVFGAAVLTDNLSMI